MSILKDREGNYKLTGKTTEADVLAAAEGILQSKLERQGDIGNPSDASNFLRMRLGALLHEEFHILWLDNRHRILDCQNSSRAALLAPVSTHERSCEPHFTLTLARLSWRTIIPAASPSHHRPTELLRES
jgi:hypothetical protein